MRILHVTPIYEPAWAAGGVVRGTSLLCRALRNLGHDVTVFTTDSSGNGRLNVPINRSLDVSGVRVFYFHADTLGSFCYSRALSTACKETLSNFELIHMAAIWNYPGIISSREAKRKGLPYVVSTDGSLQAGALKQNRLKKWIYLKLFLMRTLRGAAAIRYVSELERERTAHLRLEVPSFMVPSGLDFHEFEHLPERHVARAEFGIPDDSLVVGYLGRLDRRKALDVLIRAFARVRSHLRSSILMLGGPDYGEQARLRKLVQAHGLDECVLFLGYIPPEKRGSFLVSTDVMTLTGLEGECFGNTAVEAAAAGIPVLLSQNVGVGTTLERDGAGMVVPVDEKEISAGIVYLLGRSDLRKEMGRRGYQSARKHFDIQIVAKKMSIAYQDVLTGRRSPQCLWEDKSDSWHSNSRPL